VTKEYDIVRTRQGLDIEEAGAEIEKLRGEHALIHEMVQDIIQGTNADCENGVRWLNGLAHAEFAFKYRHTMAAITAAAKYVENWGPA
jgi:hypothetical protein